MNKIQYLLIMSFLINFKRRVYFEEFIRRKIIHNTILTDNGNATVMFSM